MADIRQILDELDGLFSLGDTEKIHSFLEEKIISSQENNETDNLITLLNEMIGFCRDMGYFAEGETYCNRLFMLVDCKPYKDTIPYATTLLNIANFKRAKKDYEESESLYLKVLMHILMIFMWQQVVQKQMFIIMILSNLLEKQK